jgi:hypothetical protein
VLVHFALTRMSVDRVRDLMTAVAGVLFALLPLRAVLVPPSVPGVTRLDLILAAQLVALIVVATWSYALSTGIAGDLRRLGRRRHGSAS